MTRFEQIKERLLPVRRSLTQCGLWGAGFGLSSSILALLLLLLELNEVGGMLLLGTAWFYPAALILTLFAPVSFPGRGYLWAALLALMVIPWSVSLAAWLSLSGVAMFLASQARVKEKRNTLFGVWFVATLCWSLFSLYGVFWAGMVSGAAAFLLGAALLWTAAILKGDEEKLESD